MCDPSIIHMHPTRLPLAASPLPCPPAAELAAAGVDLRGARRKMQHAYMTSMLSQPWRQFSDRVVYIGWHGPDTEAQFLHGLPLKGEFPLLDGFMAFVIYGDGGDGCTLRLDMPLPAMLYNHLHPVAPLDLVGCEWCGKSRDWGIPRGAAVRYCDQCRSAPFCSITCLHAAWRQYHKDECEERKDVYGDYRTSQRRRLLRARRARLAWHSEQLAGWVAAWLWADLALSRIPDSPPPVHMGAGHTPLVRPWPYTPLRRMALFFVVLAMLLVFSW